MKKRIFAVGVAALMIIGALGCSKKENNPDNADTTGTPAPTQQAAENKGETVTVDGTQVTLCEYKGISLQSVSDDEVNQKIQEVLENFAEVKEKEGPAEEGDVVNINYTGYMDGEQFQGGTDDSQEGSDVTIGEHRYIDGFEEGLIGAKKGDELDLNLTFPDPYPNNADLAGKPVLFKVKVNNVSYKILPELTDEFASENFGVEKATDVFDVQRQTLNDASFSEQIQKILLEGCTVTNVDPIELDQLVSRIYDSNVTVYKNYAAMFGMEYEEFLQMGGVTPEALEEASKSQAMTELSLNKIFTAIAGKEGITVTDEAYNKFIDDIVQYYGYPDADTLIQEAGEQMLKESCLFGLVMKFITDNAVVF